MGRGELGFNFPHHKFIFGEPTLMSPHKLKVSASVENLWGLHINYAPLMGYDTISSYHNIQMYHNKRIKIFIILPSTTRQFGAPNGCIFSTISFTFGYEVYFFC